MCVGGVHKGVTPLVFPWIRAEQLILHNVRTNSGGESEFDVHQAAEVEGVARHLPIQWRAVTGRRVHHPFRQSGVLPECIVVSKGRLILQEARNQCHGPMVSVPVWFVEQHIQYMVSISIVLREA